MEADVAFTDCAEDCVRNGVAEDIGIGVSVQALVMRNGHAAEDEWATVGEAVDIVADAGGWQEGGGHEGVRY
jgi:hypothetical protein